MASPASRPRPQRPKLKWTPQDDHLPIEHNNLTWKQIAESLQAGSSGTLQVRDEMVSTWDSLWLLEMAKANTAMTGSKASYGFTNYENER
jgi:hypothetical protein